MDTLCGSGFGRTDTVECWDSMCSGMEAERGANNRMSVTYRKSPSMCDGDGFGDRPSKQQR